MIATIAIVASLTFVGSALYRFVPGAPSLLRTVALVAALTAGVSGIVYWNMVHDSRWLVGSILLIGAAYPGWAASGRGALAAVALVLGVLGTALCGIALSHPMASAAQPRSSNGGVSGFAS